MKSLNFVFLFFGILIGRNVFAGEFMYKTSCLPELKEFRAEVIEVQENDVEWSHIDQIYGLRQLEQNANEAPTVSQIVQCELDGINYKMKFIQSRQGHFLDYYKMAVQLFREDKYLGVLYPLGNNHLGRFDAVGIKNGKIFVQGCLFEGAGDGACKYGYKEIDFPVEDSYELALSIESNLMPQVYNAIEFNCYNQLNAGFGLVNMRSYAEDISLPKNYYWLKDNPVVGCGDIKIKFKADGKVDVLKAGRLFNQFSLNACQGQVFEIRFQLDSLSDFVISYFDEENQYRNIYYCYEKSSCLQCDETKSIIK